ncbi:uncharacterized protein N0V89_010594 [Didymosphaeria variabile]|uniref:Uncharacterized protein n=1 Tax=Didymosphaeria variabile TaxID=1932322 RepID=A0A9W8XC31_9PLEO|nr:uncharacterized protein N0V89_010594 [Didymosphaeria variabile]KAJ4346663.1 hypothetical protein N0V89_010594 [Didymosphaeria variabile]
MYWTTQTLIIHPLLRSAPIPLSPHEYIFALKALMILINPLSAHLLPLFRAYNAARSHQPSPFPATYPFSLDEEIRHIELKIMYAHIVLLLGEIRAHYEDFCYLYGAYGVGEVCEMVREMGWEWAEWKGLVSEWDDLRYLVEDEGLERFYRDERGERKKSDEA